MAVDRHSQKKAKGQVPKPPKMKRPAAKGRPKKKPAAAKTKATKNRKKVSGDDDLAAATQHYSGSEGGPPASSPRKVNTRKKKASPKAKGKASPKVKVSKGKGKGKGGKGNTKTEVETPPSKRRRTSGASVPKDSKQKGGKQTFARRAMPPKDPRKTFWQSLKTAYAEVAEPRVKNPSTQEEGCRVYCLFLPGFTMILFSLKQVGLSSTWSKGPVIAGSILEVLRPKVPRDAKGTSCC